ncbi:hypothetical protein ACS0TY_029014 [Phlomoides rotata]
MRRNSANSAIQLIRRGFAAKSHLSGEKRRFPSKPRIDLNSVLKSVREVNDAIRLFREMVAMSPQPSVLVYNKLLSVLAKMEEYTVALSMFDEMRHSSFPVDEFTMNIIINCCCRLNRVDFGFAVMGSFLKKDYKPDVTTFSTLLQGLFLGGKVAEAEALFKKVLVFKLCQPNDIMILTVINGLCKSGQTLAARSLLREFEKSSYKPGVKAYNAVIDGLCRDRMIGDGLHLLPEMSNKSIRPNVVTYNTIIHGLCKDGRVDEALHLLSEMPNKRVQPNVVTYSTIVHSLCSFSRWNEVKYLLLIEMVDHKVPLDVFAYNMLIDMHCKEGNMREAESVLELMVNMNVCPDIITYNAMIEGYCLQGRMDKAKEVFDCVVDRGLKHHIISYCSLIKGYCKSGNVDEAWRCFRRFLVRV